MPLLGEFYVDQDTGDDDTGDGSLGDPWQTLHKAFAEFDGLANDQYRVWVRGTGVYTTAITPQTGNNPRAHVIGYGSTPGDHGKATLIRDFNGSLIDTIAIGFYLSNLLFDGDGTDGPVVADIGTSIMDHCEITGFAGSNDLLICSNNSRGNFNHLYIHDNNASGSLLLNPTLVSNSLIIDNPNCSAAVRGSQSGSDRSIAGCVIASNGGDGFIHSGGVSSISITNTLIYGQTGHGVNCQSDSRSHAFCGNVVASNCGGYGFRRVDTANGRMPSLQCRRCFGHSNTSGNASAEVLGDVTNLTADPFEDANSGNFNINDAEGGGALLRAVSFEMNS